jgi:hypothetical protein
VKPQYPAGTKSTITTSRRRRGALLAALLLAALAACLASASALALEHPVEGKFGPTAQPTFTKPAGAAVDPASGDVYIIDLTEQTLSRFKANGEPDKFSALASNVIDGHAGEADEVPGLEHILSTEAGETLEAEVAIAPEGAAGGTAGNIYVTNAFNGAIEIFDSTGTFVAEKSISSFPCGVAVDPSGNVFVGSFEGGKEGITKLTPTAPGVFTEGATYTFGHVCQLAAAAGFVYGAEFNGALKKLDSEGAEEGETKYTVVGASVTVAVDPSNGHLIAGNGLFLKDYDVSGASSATEVASNEFEFGPVGVAVNGAGQIYLSIAFTSELEELGPLLPEPTHTLKVKTEGQGNVSADSGAITGCETTPSEGTCEGPYNEGSEVELTATPKLNWKFKEWSGPDKGSCTTALTCKVTIPANDAEVTAVFTQITRKLKVVTEGQGNVSADTGAISNCETTPPEGTCEGPYNQGAKVKLTATPKAHWKFKEWSGPDKGACTTATTCEVMIPEHDAEVKAVFEQITHTLAITVAGTGTGSVTCSINSGSFAACPSTIAEGAKVEIKATAAASSEFKGFSLGTGSAEVCSASPLVNPCVITEFLQDSTLKATFDKTQRTLKVVTEGQGNVSANSGAISGCETTPPEGTCEGPYNQASKVKLTATEKLHWKFKEWSGPDKGACTTAATCEVTIPEHAAEVKAIFSQITHTLTLTSTGTGSGSVTCDGGACAPSYPEGTAVTLTATAASGSTFAGFSGGGCSGAGPCLVTLNADTAVSAAFSANPPPPEETKCVVPRLKGLSLARARAALSKAHCATGKVSKPRVAKAKGKGKKHLALVVKSSSPAAGVTLPAGSKVNLRLGPKPQKKGKPR